MTVFRMDMDPKYVRLMLKYFGAYMSDGDWPAGAPQPEPPFGKPVWEFIAKAL